MSRSKPICFAPVVRLTIISVPLSDPSISPLIDHRDGVQTGDAALSDGRVGLFMQNSMAEFDDFKVTGPEILNGGPGYPVDPKDRLSVTWGKIKQQE